MILPRIHPCPCSVETAGNKIEAAMQGEFVDDPERAIRDHNHSEHSSAARGGLADAIPETSDLDRSSD